MKYGYVYCITNLLNNRKYVGAKFGRPQSINEYHGLCKELNDDIKKIWY